MVNAKQYDLTPQFGFFEGNFFESNKRSNNRNTFKHNFKKYIFKELKNSSNSF